MPRQSKVIGFWKCCFVLIHKSAAVRFFECAANSTSGERLRLEGETSRSRGETGDIILLNERLRFIQNVASCYALCLTKETVKTATLVHAPACVCVCATHGGLSDTSALEIRSRGGSGFNSLPVRSPDFEKRWAIPLSAC